jgi:hypothetical protein
MRNRPLDITVLLLAGLAIVGGITLSVFKPAKQAVSQPAVIASDAFSQTNRALRQRPSRTAVAEAGAPGGAAVNETVPQALAREAIEAYLSRHRRDAASLLAAFHASFYVNQPAGITDYMNEPVGDTKYLKEAATNFPHQPQVQWVVLSQNAFPEERRKWLDSFKTTLPDNSLPNYLSAQDYFKNGQTESALNEVAEAATKSQFKDFGLDIRLDEEQLYLAAGKTPGEANTAAAGAQAAELLPELAGLKRVAQSLDELGQQYQSAGDSDSAKRIAQLGLALADKLNAGDGTGLIIGQLVGIAVEKIMLQRLEPNEPCDFLGGLTPAQRLEQLNQQKNSLREWLRLRDAVYATMTEDVWASYVQRQKIYGEAEALRWLQQQHSAATPNNGN